MGRIAGNGHPGAFLTLLQIPFHCTGNLHSLEDTEAISISYSF